MFSFLGLNLSSFQFLLIFNEINSLRALFLNNKKNIFYGISMSALLLLLKWLHWHFIISDSAIEIYSGLIALFFTIFGIWIANQLLKPKIETVIIEKEVIKPIPEEFSINQSELDKFNFTSRELEVLQLLIQGKSNLEIAESLFLSISTIKTHVSNIFIKMDVKSRTQVMDKAKRLKIF